MMAYVKKAILHLSIIFLLHTAYCTEDIEKDPKEELVESESKDGKLEIIKQIKKVNDDGSYTIGYEADDGSFKIESRDVLGNIKGTYGYIDDSGQIKRVSYSTTNSSEVLNTKPEPTSSVVQRIPKLNRTHSSTTKRPGAIYSTTQSTPTTTPRRRTTYSSTSTTTTEKPNYSEVVNVGSQFSRTTSKPQVVYATSAPPRVLLSRTGARSTVAPHLQNSEGQLSRPETVTITQNDLPLFKRLALKSPLLEDTISKPVVEESQIRSNILRRELGQDNKGDNFDPQQHVFTLQQALGDDSTDVYSASVTTGTPRPLFTTTLRPRILSSTTVQPVAVPRPTLRYPVDYLRNSQQDEQFNSHADYNQEASSTEVPTTHATPTPIPVVQIPANRPPTPEPLVAIRHPFQKGTILIPLSQIQGRLLPIELNDNLQPYQHNQQYQETYVKETTTTTERPTEQPRPVYIRRLPPPHLRPVPVHVDEHGYVRDLPPHVTAIPTPYPLPVPVTPSPTQGSDVITNEIDSITPPVSTKDFHKLLHFLIMRQKKLELVRDLALGNVASQPQPEYHRQPYRQVYQPTLPPYYVPRTPEQHMGPVQFLPAEEESNQRGRYLPQSSNRHQVAYKQHQRHHHLLYNQDQSVSATPQSYVPTRRVARLLSPSDPREQGNEEYLPPDVREMLLLKMLQLAINPSLPVNIDEEPHASTSSPQYKKVPVRNVEILGEESDEDDKRPARNKRFRDDMDYYD